MTEPLPLRQALPLVAAGGAAGALARLGATQAVPGAAGVLAVNLLGCLLLGVLVGARRDDARLRALAGTGVLGGFTTMSALAVDAAERSPGPALALLGASVAGGVLLVRLGRRLGARA